MRKGLLNINIQHIHRLLNMANSLTLVKYRDERYFLGEKQVDFVCVECGENFLKPILASVSSGDVLKTYYACPRCLAKVKEMGPSKCEEKERTISEKKSIGHPAPSGTKCNHFLGYLKKRPKNTPISDECLTCDRMIECLL
jgi:DNA-directed RNA polymerase subunit RPC12/RpoP